MKTSIKSIQKPFMQGTWDNLIIATYTCESTLLQEYLPKNVSLDLYEGKALMSLVAFTFSEVKMFGFKVPFHQNFPEINLRTYVKDNLTGIKGVLFIKEIAPKILVQKMAKICYNEPFNYGKIKHSIIKEEKVSEINYQYFFKQKKTQIKSIVLNNTFECYSSFEKFIIERKYAFTLLKNKTYDLYKIERDYWQKFKTISVEWNAQIGLMFPEKLHKTLMQKPISLKVLKGSHVDVFKV